jgi:hypothetical protein
VDAQSVKNTDTAKYKGYDAGKKVSGIKRHIAVDSQGLPHAIEVTTADVNDRKGALLMFALHDDTLSAVTQVLVDGGYTHLITHNFAAQRESHEFCRGRSWGSNGPSRSWPELIWEMRA